MAGMRSKTIRRMQPNTRKLAKTLNQMGLLVQRLKKQLPTFNSMELELKGAYRWMDAHGKKGEVDPNALDEWGRQALDHATKKVAGVKR